MTFFSKTVAERTPQGQRQSVQQGSYTFHVYNRGGSEQLAGESIFSPVIITDQEYPVRPAFSLLTKVLDDFMTQLATYITRYRDPRQADALMRVQAELDETKIVLHKTIDSVLQRGETLDTLAERSNDLSEHTKMSYKPAKRVSKQLLRRDVKPCCDVMITIMPLYLTNCPASSASPPCASLSTSPLNSCAFRTHVASAGKGYGFGLNHALLKQCRTCLMMAYIRACAAPSCCVPCFTSLISSSLRPLHLLQLELLPDRLRPACARQGYSTTRSLEV
ncbi:SNARE protein [Mycena sanguinolenta]|uniref:SNARE protein n=1 Tax=Mycena sanguinolenta TaxID=230812 RepID=A0A8H6XZ99_9AGAR|nr:SNARE protein [Mycena sanguinolenta]